MFPIRDHNPSTRTPYVTYALMAVNIVVFLAYWPALSPDPRALTGFFFDWALIPAAVVQGELMHGLLTSMFLHGGWMHLGGNMLFLWIFGDNLEDELGHLPYLGFYLATGVAAGLAQVVADTSSLIPTVGASGAIAGVMGGYLLLFPKARIDILFIFLIFFRIFPLPAWVMLGVWFGIQLLAGAGSNADVGGVAYWAHAGGFVAGFALMLPVWLSKGGQKFWTRNQGHPPHPEAQYTRSSIPSVRRRSKTDVPIVRRRK